MPPNFGWKRMAWWSQTSPHTRHSTCREARQLPLMTGRQDQGGLLRGAEQCTRLTRRHTLPALGTTTSLKTHFGIAAIPFDQNALWTHCKAGITAGALFQKNLVI